MSPFSVANVRSDLIPVTRRGKEIAKRLQAIEAGSRDAQPSGERLQFRLCDKLRLPLCSFAGTMGFQALIYRALALTKAEVPRLAPLEVDPHGLLEHLTDIEPRLSINEAAEGEVVLIGNLVDLLCTFLGEPLALRLIQNVWPEASFDEEDDEKGTGV